MPNTKEIAHILKTGTGIMMEKEILPAMQSTLIFCLKWFNTLFLAALITALVIVPAGIAFTDILIHIFSFLGMPNEPHHPMPMQFFNVVTIIFVPLVCVAWIIKHIYSLGLEEEGCNIKKLIENNKIYKLLRQLVF